ncbi:MAG: nucleotidyltransferase family protein [Pseudomonadota bacterium]
MRLVQHANSLPKEEAVKWLTTHRLLFLWKEQSLDNELREYLSQLHLVTIGANALAIKRYQDIVKTLEPIPAVPLKGIALMETLYAHDPGSRPVRDIDLLVPAQDIEAAVAALERDGYKEIDFSRRVGAVDSERTLSIGSVFVDLHSRLEFVYGRNSTWEMLPLFLSSVHGEEVYTLTDEATLVYLILHCYKHRLFSSLMWVHDILVLSEKLPKRPVDEIATLAKRLRCCNALALATTLLWSALGQDVLPQVDIAELAPSFVRLLLHRVLFLPQEIDLFSPLPIGAKLLEKFHSPLLADDVLDSGAELLREVRFFLRVHRL